MGANILKYYPQPNLPGLASNLFLQSPTPINKDAETGRVDYNLSPVRRIAGRYTEDRLDWQFANFFGNVADVDGRKILIPRKGAFVSYTDSLTPSLLFDTRVGFGHQIEGFNTPSQGFDITQLGLPASLLAQSQGAPGAKRGVFPRVSVSDLITFGGTNASANHTNTGSFSTTLTKIHGGQTWKAGYVTPRRGFGETGRPRGTGRSLQIRAWLWAEYTIGYILSGSTTGGFDVENRAADRDVCSFAFRGAVHDSRL